MPAFLLNPLIRWAAVAVVIGLLVAGVFWFKHEAKVARESQAVAERQAAISAADATRWQAASEVRDAAIGSLKDALDQQSALAEQGRAKEAELRKSLDSARALNDRLTVEIDQTRKDTIDEATRAPSDVRGLGPIILRRAPSLLE